LYYDFKNKAQNVQELEQDFALRHRVMGVRRPVLSRLRAWSSAPVYVMRSLRSQVQFVACFVPHHPPQGGATHARSLLRRRLSSYLLHPIVLFTCHVREEKRKITAKRAEYLELLFVFPDSGILDPDS